MSDTTEPTTHWEKRCELMEEAVFRLMGVVCAASGPQMSNAVASTLKDWDRLIGVLKTEAQERKP